MKNLDYANIMLDNIDPGLQLTIDAKTVSTLFHADDAQENGEAEYQLLEGFQYDYELNKEGYSLLNDSIVQSHSRKKNQGTISPNIYVGTLSLVVQRDSQTVGVVDLEVRSIKARYRSDYRDMLEFITERCTDLLMQPNSPVSHNFETDFENSSETLYQKFAFIKSVIANDEFAEAVNRIVTSPVTKWQEKTEQKDVRNIRRFKNSNIKELLRGSQRIKLHDDHYLRDYNLSDLPSRINSTRKFDTVDTPENRFIKFALERFLEFCSEIAKRAKPKTRLFNEANALETDLEIYLHHSLFNQVSHPDTLKLNSPVLQRKEGYREILRVWLMFDLAAKLIWQGGNDVYKGGKKDIATLYEYWLFFKLLDLFKTIFEIEPKAISDLIEESNDGLNLKLKQGKHIALEGIFDTGNRKLQISFNYNRTFNGKSIYPAPGSWTTTMRPDYTLTVWPYGITEIEAEAQELIVHIHFDAKYKVSNLMEIIGDNSSENLNIEKDDNKKGVYKNADLLKMHAYKDAIRRTGGAYVLYPGIAPLNRSGFHEIIPGLGAFPVRPDKFDDGIGDLKSFIIDVINHFINRASQREIIAYNTFDTYKDKPLPGNEINDTLPETYGANRDLLPSNTYVLVGFYKKENLDWIVKTGLYNARAESSRGSLRLGPKEAGSKYLLLHSTGESITGKLFRITERGPRVFSKQKLISLNYPGEPTQNFYLTYMIDEIVPSELKNHRWDIRKLEEHQGGRSSAIPYAVSLDELMRVKTL